MTKPFRAERHRADGDRRPDPRPAAEIPCGRCTARYASAGALLAHLMFEHLMSEGQARHEAVEAATGVKRDKGGRCNACHRHEDQPHTPGCSTAKKLGLPTQ